LNKGVYTDRIRETDVGIIMRTAKLTERKKKAMTTHLKIYRTALRLFEKEGFDKVTVDQVCKKAGVSKGTFYVYFRSKEQVVLDLFSTTDKMYDDFVANELASISDPMEKLILLVRKALSYTVEKGPDLMEVSYRARASLHRSGNPRLTESRAIYRIVIKLVEEAHRRGYILKDLSANEVAPLLIRTFEGLIHDWCMENGSYDLIGETEKAITILRNGLRPR